MMMGCALHGLMWAVSALLLGKILFRGLRRHHHGYGRFGGGGGCGGPRHFDGGGGWGHRHGGWEREGWEQDQGPWQHSHHAHHSHDGGPWGAGGEGPSDWRGDSRRGRWGSRKLGWLFRGLETTPEQERVLHETFGELRGAGGKIAGKVAASKNQWADALEAESFDETMVGTAVADLEQAVDEARKTAIDAFAKVHGTLDPEQRKRLASFLRRRGRGFGPFGGGGPYRSVL